MSFGSGLTPSKQDCTVTILAVAWDNLIQLFYFDNDNRTIKKDGLYVSDNEIMMCCFISDSVLMIGDTQGKLKIIYTRKFCTAELEDE